MKFLDVLFPPTCLHCQEKSEKLFCSSCLELLEMIDPSSRCPFCFLEKGTLLVCGDCRKKKGLKISLGAAFDYFGPIATLIKCLKYYKMPFLAEMVAPFLIVQHEKLGWELPDLIIPVPRGTLRTFIYGYNQSALLAEAIGKRWNRKSAHALTRSFFSIPQTQLSGVKRKTPSRNFYAKDVPLRGKTILLIDDVMTTLSTLTECATALLEKEPKKIYALTLARAL